jgi:hypothetical protein
MNRLAAGRRTSDLSNLEHGKTEAGMPLGVMDEGQRNMFGNHDAESEPAPLDRSRVIEIDQLCGEIRAISENDVKLIAIGVRIESLNQIVVLAFRGWEGEPTSCGQSFERGARSPGSGATFWR